MWNRSHQLVCQSFITLTWLLLYSEKWKVALEAQVMENSTHFQPFVILSVETFHLSGKIFHFTSTIVILLHLVTHSNQTVFALLLVTFSIWWLLHSLVCSWVTIREIKVPCKLAQQFNRECFLIPFVELTC